MTSPKYRGPFDQPDSPDASYSNGDANLGVPGSIADARAWEWPQRELIALLVAAGITPNGDDNTQVSKAVLKLLAAVGFQKLTTNLTVYIRSDGADTNDGSANDASHAFQTLARAVRYIQETYSGGGYQVKLKIGLPGTYEGVVLRPFGGTWLIEGDEANPSGYLVTAPVGTGTTAAIQSQAPAIYAGITLQNGNASGSILTYFGQPGSTTLFRNMGFSRTISGTGLAHVYLQGGASAATQGTITVSGGATIGQFLYCDAGGLWLGGTTSTPTTFAITAMTVNDTFCRVVNGYAAWLGTTFGGGAVTGKRFDVSFTGSINVGGGGATVLPGSVTGTAANGGNYG